MRGFFLTTPRLLSASQRVGGGWWDWEPHPLIPSPKERGRGVSEREIGTRPSTSSG